MIRDIPIEICGEQDTLEYSAYPDRFGFSVEGMDEYEVFETLPYAG